MNVAVNNTISNIYFNSNAGTNGNLLYENTFGNISKVISNNWVRWNNNFHDGTIGNTYYNETTYSGAYCFDSPVDSNCDNFANIIGFPISNPSSTISASSLPSVGFWSTIFSVGVVFGFLFV